MRLPILITALHYNQEQVDATKLCFDSLESQEHLLDITIDSGNESVSLTHKWNSFLDQWKGRDYQYLIITANDTEARKETIDFMVRFMEDNLNVMIGESKLNRNLDNFRSTNLEYSSNYLEAISDTSNFIIRNGLIERVGRFNEKRFPFAQNERDYIYRCKLGNMLVAQIEMQLFYHPPKSLTLENRGDYNQSVERYKEIWGGDYQNEKFVYPFNNPELNYHFSKD